MGSAACLSISSRVSQVKPPAGESTSRNQPRISQRMCVKMWCRSMDRSTFRGCSPRSSAQRTASSGEKCPVSLGNCQSPASRCGGPLFDGPAFSAAQEENRAVFLPFLPFRKLDRVALPLLPALTETAAGAFAAARLPVGAAEGGSQLHQGLGEFPGAVGGVDFRQLIPDPLLHGGQVDWLAVRPEPGEDAQHISIHRRGGEGKGNGADGSRGIIPDPRQGPDCGIVRREKAIVAFQDDPGGLSQIPHPAVVAQPLPELVQLIVTAGGKAFDIRQPLKEPGVVALHRLHPGLLEHDLRHPDVVGLPVRAPGQVPPVLPVPGQQRPGQHFKLHRLTSEM